jgi:serine/threonine-protein kinase
VLREIAAALRLDTHPNIIRAWAFLETDHFQHEKTPCLVMDYVPGPNLALWLQQLEPPGPASIKMRLAILSDLLKAIAHSHSKGVIHRDISFGNVIIRPSPRPEAVLTDFGCSQTEEPNTHRKAHPESADALQPINPPPYSTLLSREAGARRDIYAFATLCYLTLAGRHPLTDDWQSMRTGLWTGARQPHYSLLRRSLTDLAPWMATDSRLAKLSTLLLRCVNRDAAARPESGGALQSDWEEIMA